VNLFGGKGSDEGKRQDQTLSMDSEAQGETPPQGVRGTTISSAPISRGDVTGTGGRKEKQLDGGGGC